MLIASAALLALKRLPPLAASPPLSVTCSSCSLPPGSALEMLPPSVAARLPEKVEFTMRRRWLSLPAARLLAMAPPAALALSFWVKVEPSTLSSPAL